MSENGNRNGNGGRPWWRSAGGIAKVGGTVLLLLSAITGAGYLGGGAGAQDTTDTATEAVEGRVNEGMADMETGIRRDLGRVEGRVDTNARGLSDANAEIAAIRAYQDAAKDERGEIKKAIQTMNASIGHLTTAVQMAINRDSAANSTGGTP